MNFRKLLPILLLLFGLSAQAQIILQVPGVASETLWEDALQEAQSVLTADQVGDVARCLKDKWPNPILGERYVIPSECLANIVPAGHDHPRPVEPIGDMSRLQSPEAVIRPVAHLRVLQVDHYWAWEQGQWYEVEEGEGLISIRDKHNCPDGWETICDSAIVFENGIKGPLQKGQSVFIPPLDVYNPGPGVLKIPVNRSMSLWFLRGWVRENYGEFAERSLLLSPQVYVNARNEFQWRDMTTRQIITVYLSKEAVLANAPRSEFVFKKYGWW